jgi:hypothetical protein
MKVIFEYWQSEVDGLWYFHLKSDKGIIVQSVGFLTRDECLKFVHFVKRYSSIAETVQPDVNIEYN